MSESLLILIQTKKQLYFIMKTCSQVNIKFVLNYLYWNEFHPEHMAGPKDTEFLFDLFINTTDAYKNKNEN